MIRKVKSGIKKILKKKYDREYQKMVQEKRGDYASWIRQQEKEASGPVFDSKGIMVFSYDVMGDAAAFFTILENEAPEIVILVKKPEEMTKGAVKRIGQAFFADHVLQLLYTDEDEVAEGSRINPWLKPDFSPETLFSYFYFGNLVAFRGEILKELLGNFINKHELSRKQEGRENLYRLLLENLSLFTMKNVLHIKEVLYSSCKEDKKTDEIEDKDIFLWKINLEKEIERDPFFKVSVIIPSRDHPDLVKQCLLSLKNTVKETEYEVIIVDNGSSVANKKRMEAVAAEFGASYDYEVMDFNFSFMCNRGAGKAKNEILLFLNDDCEAKEEGWMEQLVSCVRKRGVGAVGAKLYYPDSRMIQHCGIYQIHVGPVHKLQFKEDYQEYYDRRNRGIRNVLAVTGACLMVKKSVFEQVGGFDESLAVAFNDVDLCYRIYEAGYRNAVNNEIFLYHHESLSRGNDEEEEKFNRLMAEKEKLYRKHPELWNCDPYYHPSFTDDILDTGYSFAYETFPKRKPEKVFPTECKINYETIREDQCIVPMIEYIGRPEGWFFDKLMLEEENFYYLQGNIVILGSDNACYSKKILLCEEEKRKIYEFTPTFQYRPDIVHNLPDQENVGLSGFSCFIDKGKLLEGKYRIDIVVTDKISGQSILRKTGKYLNHRNGK